MLIYYEALAILLERGHKSHNNMLVLEMTNDEALAALNQLYELFGVPDSTVPFIGNIRTKVTNSLVQAIKTDGVNQVQNAMKQALIAGATLAGVSPPSA